MTRPLVEVADIVRAQGDRFIHSNFRRFHLRRLGGTTASIASSFS
jgi:hypothetical protein